MPKVEVAIVPDLRLLGVASGKPTILRRKRPLCSTPFYAATGKTGPQSTAQERQAGVKQARKASRGYAEKIFARAVPSRERAAGEFFVSQRS